MVQLTRRSADTKALAVGQTIEACGYGMKDVVVSTASDSLKRFSGRLINAELIVLPDGQRLVWAGYGTGKCLEPRDRQ
jgi:hypothetical protein